MQYDIAVGIDGSPASLAAAHWAAHEAQRRGSGITLVHVWHRHARPAPYIPAGGTERAWAERMLAEAVRSVRSAHPGLRITERLVCDATVTALVTAADDAEMLVLGSSGPGPVGGFVTGSVSQRVVARADHPVVLVRAGRGAADEHLPAADGLAPEEIPETPYRDVVLGLRLDRPCDEVLDFAFETARRRGSGLRAVHAFRSPSRPRPAPSVPVMAPAAGSPAAHVQPPWQALADAEGTVSAVLRPWRAKYPTVRVTETVTEERAAAAVVRAARDAGLLVVGRSANGHRFGARTGPVTHAVLHHVGCPVAVVPHE